VFARVSSVVRRVVVGLRESVADARRMQESGYRMVNVERKDLLGRWRNA